MATEATVIDAYASLARGLPGYRPRCSAPPLQPFRIDRSEPPRKKRKTEPHLNKADIETRGHHATIVPWLSEAIERARMEHLGRPAFAGWTTGTLERYLPTEQKPDFALPATSRAVDPSASIRLDPGEPLHAMTLAGNVHVNHGDDAMKVDIANDEGHRAHLIPPRSALLLAKLEDWQEPLEAIGDETNGIDVVLLDPPWPNKSASRSSSYETFDIYELFQLDLPSIIEASSPKRLVLVAVWLTNRIKFRRFVLDKLFPSWGIIPAAENWYWVKVTGGEGEEGGRPVWPLTSEARRCYEPMVLGWYRPRNLPDDVPLPPLPDRRVFLSVPLGHSRKPCIIGASVRPVVDVADYSIDLLQPYLANDPPTVLELFARTASSGLKAPAHYISAGDEVLHYNDIDRYWIAGEEETGSGAGAA